MGNCLPKKEDLETSIVKDFAEPTVPEPTDGGEPEKIIEEEPQPEPEPDEPEPEPETEAPVEPVPEETIVEEKPKSFMDKVDAFRDSCCGVSASATATAAATTTTADVDVDTYEQDEKEKEQEEEEEEASTATEKVKPSSEETVDASEEAMDEVTVPTATVAADTKDTTTTTAATVSAPPKFKSPTFKQRRKLKKKLREIEVIEEKKANGEELTQDQLEKLASKDDVVAHLNTL